MIRPSLIIAVLLALNPALAAEKTIGLGPSVVGYDDSVWAPIELSGVASIRFDCVADDCAAGAAVYATARDQIAGEKLTIGSTQQPLEYEPAAGAIPFRAFDAWSGCRAIDNPILAAQGFHAGVAYVFTTALGDGCNSQPSPPAKRFLDLLAGVKPG